MQISFTVTAKLISAFDFAIQVVQALWYLNPNFQDFSYLLWLYSPVCVGSGRKPQRPVFSQRGSFYIEFFAGLEYVTEYTTGQKNTPRYQCELCAATPQGASIVAHVISAKHRLNYMVCTLKSCLSKLTKLYHMHLVKS